ncbi:hypothetical protein GBA52_024424 [Prunus armeniaca]|nr:hypothetical protein GBA52_024424 [Prunus armeniaca]
MAHSSVALQMFPLRSSIAKSLSSRQPPDMSSLTNRENHLRLYLLFVLCLLFDTKAAAVDELQILLKLKSTFQNSNTNSSIFSTWNSSSSLCSFSGIVCNEKNSVREIELSNQNLSGFLALDEICQLQSLEKLALGFNSLNGTIKEDLNNCKKLKYLDLGNNMFTGSFPEISSLSELQHLHLNHSGISGTFPWKSLNNMTGLIRLSLGDNTFDQSSFPSEIFNLKNLTWLYLANCSLRGSILKKNLLEGDLSEVRFLKNIVSLQLYNNGLSGEVPAEFGEFKKLVNLSLYTNKLIGTLPQKLGSWSKVDFIDVSENFLTGTIPPDMCKMGTMQPFIPAEQVHRRNSSKLRQVFNVEEVQSQQQLALWCCSCWDLGLAECRNH